MTRFMAIYTGSAPSAPPSQDTIAKGMAAWGKWMSDHAKSIVDTGGPLGKTLKISKSGIAATSNGLTGYVIVEAASQEEAARMFENHPHFAIFPGDSVDVMQVMPIPGR